MPPRKRKRPGTCAHGPCDVDVVAPAIFCAEDWTRLPREVRVSIGNAWLENDVELLAIWTTKAEDVLSGIVRNEEEQGV